MEEDMQQYGVLPDDKPEDNHLMESNDDNILRNKSPSKNTPPKEE